MSKQAPIIIGIAGGSGSGKTYFAKAVQDHFGSSLCALVYQDNFYIDQSHKFDFDGGSVNFDHPKSIDFELLGKKVQQLKNGQDVEIPIYDFATHKRKKETVKVKADPLILVDGILIFHDSNLRQLFDHLVFFDTNEDLRFQRRLSRDVAERGRTPEGVHKQFTQQVKPMHDLYVQPSMAFANLVIKDDGDFQADFDSFVLRVSKSL